MAIPAGPPLIVGIAFVGARIVVMVPDALGAGGGVVRPGPVTGNVNLHCGHAATLPSNSSGAINSLPHLGQRTVSAISCARLHP